MPIQLLFSKTINPPMCIIVITYYQMKSLVDMRYNKQVLHVACKEVRPFNLWNSQLSTVFNVYSTVS